jgi:hypothetical protein
MSMETTINDHTLNTVNDPPARPEFLKILCILSFICCGLMILIYAVGTICLALNEEMIGEVWGRVVENNPQFENISATDFFHEIGMVSLYCLIANIFSLVGVIMMWRLEKIGFFIYTVAELATNFISMDVDMGQEKSYLGTIFVIIIDLAFIVMYALNLKHMNKKGMQQVSPAN